MISSSSQDESDLKELGLQSDYFVEYPWIGEPEKRVEENSLDDKDPYFNKLGGNPAWITESELQIMQLPPNAQCKDLSSLLPQIPKLKCGNCSGKLSLVAQCYVPLGPYDRFLYVFGCNNGACSEKSNAWTCLRVQFKVDSKKVEEQKNKPKSEPSSSGTTSQTKSTTEATTTGSSSQTTSQTKSTNDWTQSVDDKELSDLLSGQEAQLKKMQQEKDAKKKQKKKISKVVSEGNLPCFALDIYEEPEMEEEFTEDSHEMKLLKQFQAASEEAKEKNEENAFDSKEAEVFAKKFMSEKIKGVTFKEDKIEDSSKEAGASSSVDHATEEQTNETLEDNDEEEQVQESAVPESDKVSLAFVHFQTVLATCPHQSIRWQFGGKPLWVSDDASDMPPKYMQLKKKLLEKKKENEALKGSKHDSDDEEDDEEQNYNELEPNPSDYAPKCDKCGAPRVFELEILPTVIYQLQCDKHVKSDVAEGMQFGCVCVFTCSNPACDGYTEQERKQLGDSVPKLRYIKEHIHVQRSL
ncbi:hypothetical protein FDP41_003108 [Naegleria fowleri]|uniref:Programmed cell death protein 2 C-terminal domain-containing protein n=1 Tax=Naegleria fowleri TaxID=5763 RepID=A0A6A5BRL5_NAEFO|nr:uncharacterized protein FDP41_003108 [Naegleria fowleri]KAF0977786.1 hypothetical protein FDP41_003108 [Naegleria fowleri]CAG4716138.1 unnamed protein product [Naegleria fowleri]